MRKSAFTALLALGAGQMALAQTSPPKLTLKDAEILALKNHPQVLAAQSEVGYANQQVVETRSAYYPTVDADVTGSAGQPRGAHRRRLSSRDSRPVQSLRPGHHVLAAHHRRRPDPQPRGQLTTSGAGQRAELPGYPLRRAAPGQPRLLRRAALPKPLVRVAEETVAARQLLFEQVSSLAQNNLRSQLDVSFADVNVSEAKLLLLRAQDSVQEAYRRAVTRARF